MGTLNSADDLNRDGETALIAAAREGRLDCVQALLPSCNAKLRDLRGRTALFWAAAGHTECVLALLPHSGAAADNNGQTALMVAAESCHLETLRALLPHSDPNALDDRGWSALAWAASSWSHDCMRVLLPVTDDLGVDGAVYFDFPDGLRCAPTIRLLAEERARRERLALSEAANDAQREIAQKGGTSSPATNTRMSRRTAPRL
ncbi:ankyrin repeat domain-containing protein [Burkholderia pseudomallei]|uniref:ankyrin repeat domain-containing protein n=1 Tax=Burkholderia pseudomallei TaxID=28450 RepID=UPI000F08E8DE|nr:ankyrin repeat domain-containing protein [Burkholderia pseudomallei]CAJ3077444.1 ankyrin [Burkholderia pseudomallei]VCK72462.1 ankyrin [Burkholderia pseudomallei]VCK79836.1 ankyrin [Burkholderia pseudomallei]VCK80167.1 ankyrin [Burkholderia pseudomallei]VCK80644.1 ankyrin [Burkholderia pseudomallei]